MPNVPASKSKQIQLLHQNAIFTESLSHQTRLSRAIRRLFSTIEIVLITHRYVALPPKYFSLTRQKSTCNKRDVAHLEKKDESIIPPFLIGIDPFLIEELCECIIPFPPAPTYTTITRTTLVTRTSTVSLEISIQTSLLIGFRLLSKVLHWQVP